MSKREPYKQSYYPPVPTDLPDGCEPVSWFSYGDSLSSISEC